MILVRLSAPIPARSPAALVRTRVIDIINFDHLPAGQNACIAVMSYSGYDIEDAVVVNKASLDRGFGRCQVMRKHTAFIRRYPNGTMDRLAGPPAAANPKLASIDVDGLPRVGELVAPDTTLVNREQPCNTSDAVSNPDLPDGGFRPAAVVFRAAESNVVDRVMISSTVADAMIVKVLMRHTRRPELGDKFSSRHGQKGVLSFLWPPEDMPFSDAGMTPDVIINPHAFPSRSACRPCALP